MPKFVIAVAVPANVAHDLRDAVHHKLGADAKHFDWFSHTFVAGTLMALESHTTEADAMKDLDKLKVVSRLTIRVGPDVEVGERVRVQVRGLDDTAKLVHTLKRNLACAEEPPFSGHATIARRHANCHITGTYHIHQTKEFVVKELLLIKRRYGDEEDYHVHKRVSLKPCCKHCEHCDG
jgi:hypothetical protein